MALVSGIALLPDEVLETACNEIAAHVGEVDVAAIDVMRLITLLFQRRGDVGQVSRLAGHLHDRRGRKRRIAAEGARRASVRAPGTGIARAEVDALALQLLQARHGIGKGLASTLHQDDDDVRTLCAQESAIGRQERGGLRVEGCYQTVAFVLRHEVVVDDVVGRAFEGGEEAEDGINGSMVEKLVLRIVHLPDIGRRLTQPAPDTNNHQRQQQHSCNGLCQAVTAGSEVPARTRIT